MSENIKRRIEKLEEKTGGDGPPRIIVCWDDDDCPEPGPDDCVFHIVRWEDGLESEVNDDQDGASQ